MERNKAKVREKKKGRLSRRIKNQTRVSCDNTYLNIGYESRFLAQQPQVSRRDP